MLSLSKVLSLLLALSMELSLAACGSAAPPASGPASSAPPVDDGSSVTPGTRTDRGFVLDNVLHSPEHGDIHYNVFIPDSYDGSEPYAVFFTLPGSLFSGRGLQPAGGLRI